jgi:hypothetical protein
MFSFPPCRRRAEVALWRATKAGGGRCPPKPHRGEGGRKRDRHAHATVERSSALPQLPGAKHRHYTAANLAGANLNGTIFHIQ